MQMFDDPEAVARYAERPPRLVPGFHDLQRMALLLLAEHAPEAARILVVGAGGGLELKTFALARPSWRFAGVDPAPRMLRLARDTLGPLTDRTTLYEGTVEAAPPGPFDGASCLLVLHFLPRAERLATLIGIRERLRPGAALVIAHHSIPRSETSTGPNADWLARFRAFATSSGIAPEAGDHMVTTMAAELPILSPEADEGLLREAGFRSIELFYAALTFRGWVARAP